MALSFGQVLSGAGAIARGQREARAEQLQIEARQAQLEEQQMRLAELRRLQNQQMAQQQALLQQQAPQMQPIEFRPGLGISQTQPPTPQPQQPAAMPSRTDAAELVRMQAAQRQGVGQATQPQTGLASPDGRLPDGTYLTMTEMWEQATPEQREAMVRGQGLETVSPESYLIGGLGLVRAGTAIGKGARAVSANRAQLESIKRAAPASTSRGKVARLTERPIAEAPKVAPAVSALGTSLVLDQAAQPAAATVVDGVDVEAQETVVQPEYTAELEAPEPEPQTRQAGVSEETNKILGNDSFYLANPNTITREMRTVMNQRQNLVRMAEIYRQGRMGEQYAQALASLQELDNNLLFLQGMEGIAELTQFRDPRRLSAVMRNVTGANIDYQPRDDGRYNLVRYNADGSFNVVQEGLTPQEISNDARLRISSKAREQAAELAADKARRDVELEYLRKQETIKTFNDMAKAWQQGQIDLAKEIAGNAGGSLQETTQGLAFTATLPTGQTVVRLYDPGREGENNWFSPDVPEVDPSFVEVPMANSAGLIQTPDVRLAETLQTWNE